MMTAALVVVFKTRMFLSTHADRQGVVVCLFVRNTVTDFSTKDKASDVKFCTAVRRRPNQRITFFCELCSPEAQNRTNRPERALNYK